MIDPMRGPVTWHLMEWDRVFCGSDAEWVAEHERTMCRAKPSLRSSAQCEMTRDHDPGGPFHDELPEGEQHRGAFHAGRTRGGYWKFWPVEKP